MSHRITLAQLEKMDACGPQRTLFRETFGRYAELTEENAIRAVDAGLRISWLASEVLTRESYAAYQRVSQTAEAAYQRVTQTAYAEYERVRQPAYAEYQRVRQPAEAEYERTCALALLRIYVAQLEATA